MDLLKKLYIQPDPGLWEGRQTDWQGYLHEKIGMADLMALPQRSKKRTLALLGYACDAGVKRNQGRPGAAKGPEAIRRMLGRLPNHLDPQVQLIDVGNIQCKDGRMEDTQEALAQAVERLLSAGIFPLVIGGGHDMAYGHFHGISRHLGGNTPTGILNFDAHFDLRSNEQGNTSGTPFYQIAREIREQNGAFQYLCLGIRKDANDSRLYETAASLGAQYIERERFEPDHLPYIEKELLAFMAPTDAVYVSIDLDGFSSAYAPGVSAPSPMGFAPDIVLESLKILISSGKVVSLDLAEMNPVYDPEGHTARLAASLLHEVIHRVALL